MYLGPWSKINTEHSRDPRAGPSCLRWFRDRNGEDVTDRALLIGFATAALAVLVLYLLRRLSRHRRRIVFD